VRSDGLSAGVAPGLNVGSSMGFMRFLPYDRKLLRRSIPWSDFPLLM
jgi:hypothetical protein